MPNTKYWTGTTNGNFQTSTNWSDGNAPGNGDTLVFSGNSSVSVNAGLSNALTTVTLIIEPGYTGLIGTYSAGVLTYLVLDGGTLNCPAYPNSASSPGSQLIAVNFGTTAATVNLETSNTNGQDSSLPPVIVKGTVLTINQTGGSLGVAVRAGETATVASVKLILGASSPSLIIGAGCTVTAAVFTAGTVIDQRTTTAPTIRLDGESVSYTYLGTGATTLITIDGGTAIYSGTGTIATATVNAGLLDFSHDQRAKTVTNSTCRKHGVINANNGVPNGIVFTNPISFPEGMDGNFKSAPGGTLQPA